MFTDEERKARKRASCLRWQKAHPEAMRAAKHRYYKAHSEAVRASIRRWMAAHPEAVRTAKRLWRKAHLEAVRAYSRRYRKAHLEVARASCRHYKQAHPEAARASVRRYARAHPEVVCVRQERRRARKSALPATLTAAEWTAICATYKQRCAYCGKKAKLTQDHVLPLSKGGGTIASNIVPACQVCNSAKGNRPPTKPVKLAMGI